MPSMGALPSLLLTKDGGTRCWSESHLVITSLSSLVITMRSQGLLGIVIQVQPLTIIWLNMYVRPENMGGFLSS